MERNIKIVVGEVEAVGRLYQTATALKVWEALPITAKANTWGDEIYFGIPVEAGPEDARETVEMGDIAYWPEGSALCIFYGQTPISQGDEIRPASPVNVIGQVEGDATVFKDTVAGARVTISGSKEQ